MVEELLHVICRSLRCICIMRLGKTLVFVLVAYPIAPAHDVLLLRKDGSMTWCMILEILIVLFTYRFLRNFENKIIDFK